MLNITGFGDKKGYPKIGDSENKNVKKTPGTPAESDKKVETISIYPTGVGRAYPPGTLKNTAPIKFISGSVERNETGVVMYGRLAEDTYLNVHTVETIAPHIVRAPEGKLVKFKKGTDVYFYNNGAVRQGTLAENIQLQGFGFHDPKIAGISKKIKVEDLSLGWFYKDQTVNFNLNGFATLMCN